MTEPRLYTTMLALSLALAGCGAADRPDAVAEGTPDGDGEWIALFDGESFDGWRGFGKQEIPDRWAIDDDEQAIHYTRAEADYDLGIITEQQYENFELRFEWKVAPEGNSGVFFRVAESYDAIWHTGPEYQVVDNDGHPDGDDPVTAAGSTYALYGPEEDFTRPAGEWNTGRIVVRGTHVEHHLNGRKIVEYELGSGDWQRRVEASVFNDYPDYGTIRRGHISLQDGGPVWYRNIKLRELD